jgi:hypothetical protein
LFIPNPDPEWNFLNKLRYRTTDGYLRRFSLAPEIDTRMKGRVENQIKENKPGSGYSIYEK